MADQLKKGDEVTWNWGNGHPSGTVKDVREEDTEIESKNGKPVRRNAKSSQVKTSILTDDANVPLMFEQIKKKGDEENPAVVIEQDSGNPVLKKASELNEVDI